MSEPAQSSRQTPRRRLSFEYFPPRTETGRQRFEETVARLDTLAPNFVSVTCAAQGSRRSGTEETVSALISQGIVTAPHISVGAMRLSELDAEIDRYAARDVNRYVALRGDAAADVAADDEVYGLPGADAEHLVRHLRRRLGEAVAIEVAGYPETHPRAASPAADLASLKRKVDAGANAVLTQFFFLADAYQQFRERAVAAGITAPIIPGILPLTSHERTLRFAADCGARVPDRICQELEKLADDQQGLADYGVSVISRLCQDLLAAGAPGLHFYTLNQWRPTSRICANLGINPARAATP